MLTLHLFFILLICFYIPEYRFEFYWHNEVKTFRLISIFGYIILKDEYNHSEGVTFVRSCQKTAMFIFALPRNLAAFFQTVR